MKDQTPTTVALAVGLLIASGFTAWLLMRNRDESAVLAARENEGAIASAQAARARRAAEILEEKNAAALALAVDSAKLKDQLRERLEQKDSRTHEAVLTF